jgi:hypothetical protein
MSLIELVDNYVRKHDVILTSASGEGCTVLALYMSMVLSDNKIVIYFNPLGDIDREYVQKYYPRTFKDVLFIISDVKSLIEFLNEIDYEFDYLIIDPGDVLMVDKTTISNLKKICRIKGSHMIFTSQIRLDPKIGWNPVSTIESLKSVDTIFDYSIWMRRATEDNPFFISKYIDVFKGVRIGNRYIGRYLVRFNREGCMIT